MAEKKKTASDAASGAKDNRMMMLVAYILSWLTGLIVYFTAGKDDPEVRFHAVQAIGIGIAQIICAFFFWLFFIPLLISFALWIYGIYIGYKAYSTGERILVPFIGEYAVKYSEK